VIRLSLFLSLGNFWESLRYERQQQTVGRKERASEREREREREREKSSPFSRDDMQCYGRG